MNNLYTIEGGKVSLHFHPGQQRAWDSEKRFVFIVAGTQGGKTSWGSWWLWREIQRNGAGDYIAATSSYDLFKLKMLPEIRNIFENVLKIGRFWAGEKIMELRNPETGEFQGARSDDPSMWGRIILRSASAEGGLESATAKAAWLDELGQDEFRVTAWEAVLRRLSLSQGRVLGTTTPYNVGWLKQLIYDRWRQGDPDIDVIQFDSTLNPSFPQAEFERARATMPEWKFNMFYRGQFTRPAGMIYEDFIDDYRENGGHKVKPFQLSTRFPRYVGVDPGAVNHATLWLAHDTEADIYYAYRETLEGGMSTSEHAGKAYETARANGENVVIHVVGQVSEVQQRLDWQAAGVTNVTEPPFRDVEAGIDKVIQLLREHRLFFFDDLTKTLDQLGSYARVLDDVGQSTDKIKDKERYHLLDCLRYAAAYITNPPQESFYIAPIVGLYDRRPHVR